ncbi:MAG: hypothetical protein HYX78_01605 [Armatimonadetes bacterium]|nr:hypothetical protein [Armatimonadota bacterium]
MVLSTSYLNPNPGWRLWDAARLNGVVMMPGGLELVIEFRHSPTGDILGAVKNDDVVEFGPYAIDGSYARLDFNWRGWRIRLEYACDGGLLACRCSSAEADCPISVAARIEPSITPGQPPVRLIGPRGEVETLQLPEGGCVAAGPWDEKVSLDRLLRFIEERRLLAINEEKQHSDGWIGIERTIMWQTIYSSEIERAYTPVGRDVCEHWGGYVLFSWDAFFAGLLSSLFSPELAEANVRAMLDAAMPNGMVPNMRSTKATSYDRSGPPVGSHCVWEIYKRTKDKGFLERTFDGLLAWHRWYGATRDGNGDGLLEYGSSPKYGPEGSFCLQGAKFESGLDNSHTYDNATFNSETATMELVDVGLNSLWAHDAECLAFIALELGRSEIAHELMAEYNQTKSRMNDLLWSEYRGIYLNRHWNGKFSEELSPTLFYPLLAGAPSRDMALRMIREHLLNEEEFWGEYVIPSTPRNHPAFHDGDYWRGRIWGPMNYLVWAGLKRMGFEREAGLLAEKSLNLFLRGWKERTHCYEHYSPIDGTGWIDTRGGAHQSFPAYFWGGLLAFLSVARLS